MFPHNFLDDDRTVTPVSDNEYLAVRSDSAVKPRLVSEQERALAKLKSLEDDFKEEFDEYKQLSHMSFAQKYSVCYEALFFEKGHEATKQIVRVTHEGWKADTCTLTKAIRREQRKPSATRDERSLLYFPTLTSVDVEPPVLVTVEERIVGQELVDVIHACRFPMGAPRLGYMCNLFIQMCHGVAFLHEHGYTHNDLAPDNVLVEQGLVRIKIIDFDSAVNLSNPSNPHMIDGDGTVLHDWFQMQLYHKEHYRAVECWKAYELICTNRQRRVFLDLRAADTFALLMLFWEMLMGEAPPLHQLKGADDLAKQFAEFGDTRGGGRTELAEAFEQGFDFYFGDVIEGLSQYPVDIQDNLESLFNDIAEIKCTNVDDDGLWSKVRVKRDSVQNILNMDWLRRARTI